MAASLQRSNIRLLLYSSPVLMSFLFALANGGAVNVPYVEILSQIKAQLGSEGFTILREALALLGSGGVNLLTGEAHERIKSFFQDLKSEELLNDRKFQELVKKTIIHILNEEKGKPEYADQKENIEKLVKALEKYYETTIELKNDDVNRDIQNAILNSFDYEAEALSDDSSALNADEWKQLLEDAAIVNDDSFYQEGIGFRLSIPADFQISINKLAETLEKDFAKRFQNFLEKDFAESGETFAKFSLDFLKKINNSGDEIKNILTEYKKDIEAIKQNTSLALQQGQINHAELREFLDKVSSQVNDLQNGLSSNNKVVAVSRIIQNNKEIRKGFRRHDKQITLVISLIKNLPSQVADEIERRNLKSSKPKPKGLINLPREKNDYFVEQSNVFERIDAQLTAHHLAYLHGTHGLGKTTTLNEYARERVENYDFIFYVLATEGAIETEMARLADEFLETVHAEDTPAQKASNLKAYLEENERWTKTDKNWLIIFDNLESRERISQYFPRTAKGDCLYACNEKLFVGNDREVSFEQFSPEEAERFVYQKLNRNSEAKHADIPAENLAEIKKLIERLGRLPLALNIAAVYLIETEISIDDYLGLLKANVGKFLKYTDAHREHQNDTAFEAFLITLDKIKHFKEADADGETIGKLAETFLNLLIFCAPEDIPEELVKDALFQSVDASGTSTPPNILFRETVALLKRYGLVKEKKIPFKYREWYAEPKTLADGTTVRWEEKETVINVFDTYRILQDILSVKLENETKKILIEQLLSVVFSLLPHSERARWEIGKKYVIHVLEMAKYAMRN